MGGRRGAYAHSEKWRKEMKFLRVGICALVVFGVLAHGGVEDWARAVFEIGIGLLFLSWAVRYYLHSEETILISPLLPALVGFLLVVLAQLLFSETASIFNTHQEFMLLLADVIMVFLAVQAFRTVEDWRGFVWFLMIFGFVVSVFGILQHFTFNGKLYWFREMRYGGIPFGPYVNRNHFAGFVELIIPLGVSLLRLRAEERDRLPLLGVLTLMPIGALFLSASRGGIAAFFLELGLVVILAVLRGHGRNQLVAGAVLLLLAGGFVVWLGAGRALDRFEAYQKLELSEDPRAEMLRGSWRIFVDHPLAGTGLGTLEDVF